MTPLNNTFHSASKYTEALYQIPALLIIDPIGDSLIMSGLCRFSFELRVCAVCARGRLMLSGVSLLFSPELGRVDFAAD